MDFVNDWEHELGNFDEEWKEVTEDGKGLRHIHWGKLWSNFRWFINLILIAIPWTLIDIAAIAWNIYFNIEYNRGWCKLNLYLVANTIYLIYTAIVSFFVVAEIPAFLRIFKTARYYSFNLAVIWVLFYLISVGDLIYMVNNNKVDDENLESMFIAMTITLNAVLHLPTFIISLGLVLKELTLEFF